MLRLGLMFSSLHVELFSVVQPSTYLGEITPSKSSEYGRATSFVVVKDQMEQPVLDPELFSGKT